MSSINGIGTSLYGKQDVDPIDGSYIATKWFIVVFLPIFPLGSYRVIRGETTASGVPLLMPGAKTQYHMVKIELNWKQIIQIYLGVYGIIALIILFAIFAPIVGGYLALTLFVLGFIYSIYHLFKIGKKWWGILLIISALVIGGSMLFS